MRPSPTVSPKQRLQNLHTKNNIMAARLVRQFMSGQIDVLPCLGDEFEASIGRETQCRNERRVES